MTSHGGQIIICTINSKLYIIQVKNMEHINTLSKNINGNFSTNCIHHCNEVEHNGFNTIYHQYSKCIRIEYQIPPIMSKKLLTTMQHQCYSWKRHLGLSFK